MVQPARRWTRSERIVSQSLIKPTEIPEGMAEFLRQGAAAAARSEADRVHMARSFADAPPVLI
jgi:hypothetical protein